MAGKHVGLSTSGGGPTPGSENNPPMFPGSKLDKCYRDGRLARKAGALAGTNPFFVLNLAKEFNAWSLGWNHGADNTEAAVVQTGNRS